MFLIHMIFHQNLETLIFQYQKFNFFRNILPKNIILLDFVLYYKREDNICRYNLYIII
jgi:hypothetical protein